MTGLVTFDIVIPEPTVVGVGRIDWKGLVGSGHSRLDVELWRLSLSLPCPEEEKPLG